MIEAARFAPALETLNGPATKTTVTVDILKGGGKANVVPAHAELKADVRTFTNDELNRVEQAATKLAASPSIDGITMKTSMQRSFPPWPPNEHEDRVIQREHRLYAEIGRKVTATEVGSSADVSYATWKAFLPRGARCLASEAEWIRRRVSRAFRIIAYATATIRKERWCGFSKEITTPAREGIQPNTILKRAARARRFLSRVQSTASEVSSTDPSNSRSIAPQPES